MKILMGFMALGFWLFGCGHDVCVGNIGACDPVNEGAKAQSETVDTGDAKSPIRLKSVPRRMKVNTTLRIEASGGTPPYTFLLLDGEGTVDASGLYTAPSEATDVWIRVSDDEGRRQNFFLEVYE